MDGSVEEMMINDKKMKIIIENANNQKKLMLNTQKKVNK
jgi:predicted regulator of Ras-like GTPase activity (Roadblock/LC7/MglB family)